MKRVMIYVTINVMIFQLFRIVSTCLQKTPLEFQTRFIVRNVSFSFEVNSLQIRPPTMFPRLLFCYDQSSGSNPHTKFQSLFLATERISGLSSVVLFMGKGDGKKKRPKTSTTDAVIPSLSSSIPAAPRVSNQINIPLRHQLKLAQFNKESQKEANGGFRQQKKVERTSYRRAWDEEEIIEKAEERKRRGQDPNWDVILNRTAVQPLVIVDGYNVIHKWARLKKHMMKGDTQRARQLLVDDLENLRTIKGWRIEVVFDGAKRSLVGQMGHGPGGTSSTSPNTMAYDQSTKKDVSKFGVRVIYTGAGNEADSYIEQRCMSAKNITGGSYTGALIIATDDAMIRIAGQNAGAWCMGSDRFVQELKAVQSAVEYRVELAMSKVNGQPIRPEKLRGTHIFTGTRFGRKSVLIEDKRNRTKTTKPVLSEEEIERIIGTITVEESVNGIPWWAQVPNQTLHRR